MDEREVGAVGPAGGPRRHAAPDGESPLRYFDAAPHVRVLIGDREVAAFDPAGDFDQTVTFPADLLAAANGRVVLESSKFFVPGGTAAATSGIWRCGSTE